MRWYVDINSIGSSAPTHRYCIDAEQWQKALQSVRATRGDDAPFGNFSIELLDDGYRAIDPLTRTRYVVQRAPDDAATTSDPLLLSADGKSVSGASPQNVPAPRASRPRASSRGRRGRSPSIPDDPVPVRIVADNGPATRPSTPASKATSPATAASSSIAVDQPPLVAPKPMQAETAFERMTGGAAVPLPTSVSPTADVPTEVLPSFNVISQRSEDPTPSSPLTYRELAISVAEATTLRDAEAIARAQFEVLRNALSSAPKGKFIQLAVFDHEFTARPKKPPVVTLAFKDWRTTEPEIRYPARDGVVAAGPVSMPPRAFIQSVQAASQAPQAASQPPQAASQPPQAASQPPQAASQPPQASAAPEAAAPAASSPDAPAPSTANVDAIRPSRVVSIGDDVPPQAPSAIEIPGPTPSEIRASATDMAGDDERTLVKPSSPPPAPEASPEPTTVTVPPVIEAPPVSAPPAPAPISAPPAPAPVSAPPVAMPRVSTPPVSTPPVSAPPVSGPMPPPGLLIKGARGSRKSGDDLLTDLFEATSDLNFVRDALEGAEFVVDLIFENIPSLVILLSFFDINTREFVVVRQSVVPTEGEAIPSVVLSRASEFADLLAATMRAKRTNVVHVPATDAVAKDPRWRALGIVPSSLAITPVISGGRFLGVIEVANPLDGAPFTEGDGHALTYIGEQFAELLAQREILIDERHVLKPKLSQLARRP